MAKLAPKCSECPNRLVFPEGHEKAGKPKPAGTKTCSSLCRSARARREKRNRANMGKKPPKPTDEVAAAVRGETQDVAHEVMKEELRPIVRESMTADVLSGIQDLISEGLPTAIQSLHEDLQNLDDTIRQRAYTLLLKYTMGNPSVAPPPTQQAPAPMTVTFNVPRPGGTTLPGIEAQPPGEAEELRTCTDCSQEKVASEFVGASPRCQACFDGLHDTLRDRFAVDDETAPDA